MDDLDLPAAATDTPDAAMLRADAALQLERALGHLPLEFREVIVLRELQGLTYQAISEVVQAPIGTVMSRLARAREQLARVLTAQAKGA